MDTLSFIDVSYPWFFPLVVFVSGACIGSFLNVCIVRIPKGESIIWPPSHSVDGRRLSWWENIPVISWILLRGRDRFTRKPFGVRYLVVELLTAVLFMLCWLSHEPAVAIIGMVFLSILVAGTFIDLEHMILPDRLTIGGMVFGVIVSFVFPVLHLQSIQDGHLSSSLAAGGFALISVIVGSGLVYWIGELGEVIFRKPAMGLGDVKLVGCIAAFCGWQGAVFSLFGGAIVGCVLLLPYLIIIRLIGKQTDGGDGTGTMGMEVPFGPMLAIGGALYFLGANAWVDPYFSLIGELIFG